ncbi:hypothetical protein COX74_02490 [bacterium (Candidatus Gribaldobacteria) CG_4_10_14_0_2_um_filter_41_16]|uniref:Ferric oxidoreductase domain-containing protein n=2 Tax=Candidatus Gribaldobacteria TaxID=2798536 RepID=A0A2M7VIK0_9BACT|nr:MAG: hypothetical protein AUJ36_04340 [Parcubacteria group bacterium CG1_02_41_26]PIX03259.1 MAG: hypothetical protein COZ78_01250 [bacterium (Candidatus Gribaldobacteria) CG_4_8_14_3_um_filter_42_11]PJA01489.1 MAG: hypothetical protein COX74_02490 [bacterium (Candidatus Gribaldobacteria) CG_4_10_14_0_2_um_filter_41_16]
MIIIFGKNLVYWSGMLTGVFFVLSFLGCCCNLRLAKNKFFRLAQQYHKKIIYFALVFFFLHLVLAVLGQNFKIWI